LEGIVCVPFISRILRLCTNNAEVETPSEIEFQQETEIENPEEIEITTLQAVRYLGATRPRTAEKSTENQIHLSHFCCQAVKNYH